MQSMQPVEARYEEGLLKPTSPLSLRPGERVGLIVIRLPDPDRWDLDRLSRCGKDEDVALTEQGLGEWAEMLDDEDRG